jgi:hypothetical protein
MWVDAVDYSFSKPTPSRLAAAGIKSAGTYVGPGTEPKHLQPAERDALFASGLSVFLNVEGASGDAKRGATVGAYHGHLAVAEASQLGAPAGVALIAAIDWDVQAPEWPAVSSYMRAYAPICHAAGYRAGLYGGLNAITWAARDGLAEILFQTYGWSRRVVNGVSQVVWHPAAQIQQYRNGVNMAGGNVDQCHALAPDWGQWGQGGSAVTQPSAKATWDYSIGSPSLGQTMAAGDWLKYAYSGAQAAGAAAASSAKAVALLEQLVASGSASPDTLAIVAAIKADGDQTRQAIAALTTALHASAAAVIDSLPVTPQ